jgi:hypothetical protein
MLSRLGRCGRWPDEPLLVQDAAHQRLAHPDALAAGELVADPPCPMLGVLPLGGLDRLALRRVRSW